MSAGSPRERLVEVLTAAWDAGVATRDYRRVMGEPDQAAQAVFLERRSQLEARLMEAVRELLDAERNAIREGLAARGQVQAAAWVADRIGRDAA